MKTINFYKILFLFLILFNCTTGNAQSIYGWERIMSSNYGINEFYMQHNSDNKKIWMVRPVRFITAIGDYESFKYNNNSNSWYSASHSIFIACYYNYYIGYTVSGHAFPYSYSYSHYDTSFILLNHTVPRLNSPPTDIRLFYSYDNGISKSDPVDLRGFKFSGIAINPLNDSVNYAVSSGTLYRSDDRGISWAPFSVIPSFKGKLYVNPADTNFVYAHNDSLFISSNGGAEFNYIFEKNLKQIIFRNSDSALLSFDRKFILSSHDNGYNWSILDSLQDSVNVIDIDPDNENIVFAGTSKGLYKSVNYGEDFTLFNNSFSPSRKVIGLCKETGNNFIYVVTEEGVYKCWNDFVININDLSGNIPNSVRLYQNFPNPFNPETKIKFEVVSGNSGKNTHVIISVYNSLGTKVTDLVNEIKFPGSFEINFRGNNLASGIYFYKLSVDGVSNGTKRMVLLK